MSRGVGPPRRANGLAVSIPGGAQSGQLLEGVRESPVCLGDSRLKGMVALRDRRCQLAPPALEAGRRDLALACQPLAIALERRDVRGQPSALDAGQGEPRSGSVPGSTARGVAGGCR